MRTMKIDHPLWFIEKLLWVSLALLCLYIGFLYGKTYSIVDYNLENDPAFRERTGEPHPPLALQEASLSKPSSPVVQEEDGLAVTASSTPDEQAMLDAVIMCESSGRHENIWGRDGEYGILQFKEATFYSLAEKYNFVGNWQDKDDQIALFLLTSPEDKERHWTCVRLWKAGLIN